MTVMLTLLTGVVSYFAFQRPVFFERLKHHPYAEVRTSTYDRLLTAGFVHGSWTHLLVNMFVFFQFGSFVEKEFVEVYPIWGRPLFLFVYLSIIILANVPTLIQNQNNPTFASIGASGGVSGVLFMYILDQPWAELLLYFILPFPAILIGISYLVYSSWASKNSRDRIDHSAHFYGAVFGCVLYLLFIPEALNTFIREIKNIPYF